MADHLMATYNRLPVQFERARASGCGTANTGSTSTPLAGIAVCGLGHAHPAVTQALCEQAGTLVHTSNLYGIDPAGRNWPSACAQLSGMERAFFCNSGAEANEAAIKIARLYGHGKGIDCPAIIVMENSFHGRTLATLTATGNRRIQAGFEPLVQGLHPRALQRPRAHCETVAGNNSDVVAVLVEPVQGEGGINVPDADYLAGIRDICDDHGWLMMLDEIQTGIGRTGQWFACQHSNASAGRDDAGQGTGQRRADRRLPGARRSRRGPAARQPRLHLRRQSAGLPGRPRGAGDHRAGRTGGARRRTRATHAGRFPRRAGRSSLACSEIRGHGLMIGIELDRPCGELVGKALQGGC